MSFFSLAPLPPLTCRLDELKQISDNPQKFNEFLEQLDWVKTVNGIVEDTRNANAQYAQTNLSIGEELEKSQNEINDMKARLNLVKAEYEKKAAKQQEILQQYTPRMLLDRLNIATSKAEYESDELSDSYLASSGTSIDDFLQQYMAKRTLYYLRKSKKVLSSIKPNQIQCKTKKDLKIPPPPIA